MLKQFLNKYDTIIFDMDGVITSEQNYWNSAALTVNEYLNSRDGIKTDTCEAMRNLREIRKTVFLNDSLITLLKSKGVNSNWDLGYVTVCISVIVGTRDAKKIYKYAEGLADNILDEYGRLAKKAAQAINSDEKFTERNGQLWTDMHYCFQEWFLGDVLYRKTYGSEPKLTGKPGLVYDEQPIIQMDKLKAILSELAKTKRVAVGTGRPAAEIIEPLRKWDCLKYFAVDGLINYDHVVKAESELCCNALTKPHPYMFIKALMGEKYSDGSIIDGQYGRDRIKTTLVVGDAGSDIMAAKAMGADFCAVLTGAAGKSGRGYFEAMGAEYIFDSIEDFLI